MSEVEGKIEAKVEVVEQAPPATAAETQIKNTDAVMKDVEDVAAGKVEEVKKDEQVKDSVRDNDNYRPRYVKKNKFDPSSLPESSDADAIRRQVEFYFSDSNLLQDTHLLEKTQSEKNLPVDVTHIHSFKRMRHFQPYSAVVEALKHSRFLKITGDDGKEQVQRVKPFDGDRAQKQLEMEQRSVYVKGFGDEERESQMHIEEFFNNYGATNQVRLRRHDDGLFKGSAYCEFVDIETAQKFLDLDPKPTYKDQPPFETILSREVYQKGKNQDILDGKVTPGQNKYHDRRNNHRGGGNFRGDKDDWKNRRDHDRKNGFQGGRGRGGRGNGRGNGRGRGGRDGRDNRDRRDDRDRQERKPEPKIEGSSTPLVPDGDAKVSVIKDTSPKSETAAEPSNKRARENDDVDQSNPSKKEKLESTA